MKINLIDGVYSLTEAQSILKALIDVKIQFLESKISSDCNEEDIKRREQRIRVLQDYRSTVCQMTSDEIKGIDIQLSADSVSL
jgi:hypothetical protein